MKALKLATTLLITMTISFSFAQENEEIYTPLKTQKTLSEYKGLEFLDEFSITPVQVGGVLNDDPEAEVKLGSMYQGKWVILDISATWCGYCKIDQVYFSAHKNEPAEGYSTNDELWSEDVVQVHLNIEDNREGGRQQTFDLVRFSLTDIRIKHDKALSTTDRKNIDSHFINIDDKRDFLKALDSSGAPLLPGFTGYPYQIIINPKGDIIFSSGFTKTESEDQDWWVPYVNHYTFITEQMKLYRENQSGLAE